MDLTRAKPGGPSHADIKHEIWDGSDRACALVAGAYLDQKLKGLILLKLIDLTEEEDGELFEEARAPLNGFSTRIAVAYALGTITKVLRDDLNRVRRIRNAFAHSVSPLSFENDVVRAECSKLQTFGPPEEDLVPAPDDPARSRFVFCVYELAVSMMGISTEHYKAKLKETKRKISLKKAADRRKASREKSRSPSRNALQNLR